MTDEWVHGFRDSANSSQKNAPEGELQWDGELDFSGSSTGESPSLPAIMPPVCGANLSEP